MADVKLSIDDIRFERGNLWSPRYDCLIDYSRVPRGFQLEPAFMLRSADEEATVEVTFEIPAEEKVAFDVLPDGSVRWKLLVDPKQTPPVSVEVTVLETDHRVCKVVWTRTGAILTALQIRCRHTEGGPQAYTDDWAWSVVEGGVYLVIIDPGKSLPNPTPAQKQAGPPLAGAVRLLGIDEHHRPVYDVFTGNVPPELILEPAFRARHGQDLDFRIALDLPDFYADARFEADAEGQAEMLYAVPPTRPASLAGAPVDAKRDKCTIEWRRPLLEKCATGAAEATTDPCRQGTTSNFYAKLMNSANQELRVDPTVIEPPACDASGVCGPPRGRSEKSSAG